MTEAVRLENVEKRYRDVPALRSISFAIGEGDAFGFIGPNGAGKTTTLKILATLLQIGRASCRERV